jgi:hypothetical protein
LVLIVRLAVDSSAGVDYAARIDREGGPMTESEWLSDSLPEPLFQFLLDQKPRGIGAWVRRLFGSGTQLSQRKLRLFACGCARLVWDTSA